MEDLLGIVLVDDIICLGAIRITERIALVDSYLNGSSSPLLFPFTVSPEASSHEVTNKYQTEEDHHHWVMSLATVSSGDSRDREYAALPRRRVRGTLATVSTRLSR